jgi:hypothetical protein
VSRLTEQVGPAITTFRVEGELSPSSDTAAHGCGHRWTGQNQVTTVSQASARSRHLLLEPARTGTGLTWKPLRRHDTPPNQFVDRPRSNAADHRPALGLPGGG